MALSQVARIYSYTYGGDASSSEVTANEDAIITGVNNLVLEVNTGMGTTTSLDARFDAVELRATNLETSVALKSPIASPTFTGTPTAPTAGAGTATTQIATTGFVAASFAPLASPALTGTPTAPTPTVGTDTTQLATCEFVNATAFASVANLPGQGGNSGKYLTTDGSNAAWGTIDTPLKKCFAL